MKILVINGPNLNMLGIREPEIYGYKTYSDLLSFISLEAQKRNIEVKFFQSNYEGAIIDEIQKAYFDKLDGIIINPGAYTHYSYAIHDAITSTMIKTIEVHLSDITKRENFRKVSVISPACHKTIYGKGFDGYIEALDEFVKTI